MTMLLGHPMYISFCKHIRSLFYFHDTITVALRRYKTAILSKQSTFLGLYQGAAAAGAENDLRLCARQRRIKRKGREEETPERERERKDLHRLYIRKFSEYFVAFLPLPFAAPFRSISVYVKSRRDVFSFFSRACMSIGRNFLFLALRYFAQSTVKNLRSSHYSRLDKSMPSRILLSLWNSPEFLFFLLLYSICSLILREILYFIYYISHLIILRET